METQHLDTVNALLGYYVTINHRSSVAALGRDAKEFFAAHGYTLARLARRNRVAPNTMQAFFKGRTISARLVRNLAKLRVQLESRDRGPLFTPDEIAQGAGQR